MATQGEPKLEGVVSETSRPGAGETSPPGVVRRLAVNTVRIGKSFATAIASSITATSIAGSELVVGTPLAANSAMSAAVQVDACRKLLLKIPLGEASKKSMTKVVEGFLKENPTWVDKFKSLPVAQQIRIAGFDGALIPTLASFAVQEALIFFSLLSPTDACSTKVVIRSAVSAFATCGGSLGGSVAGAAAGSCVLPGIGTTVGSTFGSIIGSQIAAYLVPSTQPKMTETTPPRFLKVTDDVDEWLLVDDATNSEYFRMEFDDLSDIISIGTNLRILAPGEGVPDEADENEILVVLDLDPCL